ncbi:MAG: hypothetical protein ACYDA1_03230 [Vulcanimicrobiaceae bacterium]
MHAAAAQDIADFMAAAEVMRKFFVVGSKTTEVNNARCYRACPSIAVLLVFAITLNGFVVIASGYFAALLPGFPILSAAIGLSASFAVLWLGLSLVFYFVPECHVEWRDVRIGTALTTLFL